MLPRPPAPARPEPKGKWARQVVEWADVVYYVFWLAFSAAIAVAAVLHYGPAVLELLAR